MCFQDPGMSSIRKMEKVILYLQKKREENAHNSHHKQQLI